MNVLPSDRLARRWTWKGWTALGASVALVAGLGVTAVVTGPLAAADPSPTATYVVPQAATCNDYRGGVCYTPDDETAAMAAEQKIEADNAAAAAAAQAAAQAAAEQAAQQQRQAAAHQPATQESSPTDGGLLPAGAVVPSIPGTTSPDTTKCASGTASDNASGVAVCD